MFLLKFKYKSKMRANDIHRITNPSDITFVKKKHYYQVT